MHTLKAIIVDDEINSRENLRGVLDKFCPEVTVLGEACSAVEAIQKIQEHKPMLIFLDIEMPGGNGFEVLKYFQKPEFGIIFITAYDHYAIQAIRFSALDYILKPIDTLQLKAAIQRYIEQVEAHNERLIQFIKNNKLAQKKKKIALASFDKIDFVEVNQIIKCEGQANYTTVFLASGEKMLVSKSLIEYEDILFDYGFVRTHKSHIVNIDHVKTFIKNDGGYLLLSDGSTVPLSRRKRDFVLSQLKT